MKLSVYRFSNKEVIGEVDIDTSALEGLKVGRKFLAMHFARMKAAHLSQRKAKVKNQSEVSGTTAKPFKQKGTGKARQGTTRASHHVGGGTVFGPRGMDRKVKVPKKEVRLAKKLLLSEAIKKDCFFVVDDIKLSDHRTKTAISCFENFVTGKHINCLVLHDGVLEKNNILASRNLIGVKYATIRDFTTYDILKADSVLIPKDIASNLAECLK